MKKIILFFALCTLIFTSYSQQTDGYLQYTISVQAVDTTLKAKQQAGMLRNSKMEMYYSQNFSRVDFTMGEMYKLSAVVNLSTNRTISLMSGAIGKFATRTITTDSTTVEEDKPVSTVELLDESKVILGYNCKMAIVTTNGLESTYWYTDEVKIDMSGQQISNDLVPGFPLEFYTVSEGVMMHFTASNIEFSIENHDEIFFTEIPEGYVLMQDVGEDN